MLLTAQVLISVAIVGFAVVPPLADLNRTHATNPTWVGHARYHVVWQSISYLALGVVAAVLTWTGDRQSLYVAIAIAGCVYAGFFGAALSMRSYGGRMRDDNGHAPVRLGSRLLDRNLLLFTPLVAVLGVGAALALAA